MSPRRGPARVFVRQVILFNLGTALGLTPYLGNLGVPLFSHLLDLYPVGLKGNLIAFSSLFLGLVSVAINFFSGERVTKKKMRKLFGLGLGGASLSLLGLFILHSLLVVQIDLGDGAIASFVLANERLETCGCAEATQDKLCLKELSMDPAAIESCWDSRQVSYRRLLIAIPYLLFVVGLGIMIGTLALKGAR